MKIAVAGAGYAGLSNAILLAQHNEAVVLDIVQEKIDMLNNGISPISDPEISDFLQTKNLNFRATSDKADAYSNAEYVVVATPTDYDEDRYSFDTRSVESVIADVFSITPTAIVVIKSTVPIGFTKKMRNKFKSDNIIFSPEFLREGKALHDNLHPSRIVVGDTSDKAEKFASLLKQGAVKKDVDVFLTNSNEAEAIKLFANTYLAMRVAFFNELDSFSCAKGLNPRQIINGVCSDPRIGSNYNNPSFGYGGYCLPKDTKQLRANFSGIPQNLIRAIVDSNDSRKYFLAGEIYKLKPKVVGAYKLAMKAGSDNHRSAAVLDILDTLRICGCRIVVFDDSLTDVPQGFELIEDFVEFKNICDVILSNRYESALDDVREKVFTRDIFGRDS